MGYEVEVHIRYMVEKLKSMRKDTRAVRTFWIQRHVSSFCSSRELIAMTRTS